MILFIIPVIVLALAFPLYAAPVTQASSADTLVYDAVVVGTNNVVELLPGNTGIPSPISTLTNVDIVSCASEEICIEEIFTDSASHVASSIVAEFNVLPTSIATALGSILGATETGIVGSRNANNATTSGLLVSSTSGSRTQSGTTVSTSAFEGSSGRFALSTGTPSMQDTSPQAIPSISTLTTVSVISTGAWAMTSALNFSEANNPTPASEGSSGRSTLSAGTPPVQSATSAAVSGPSWSTATTANSTGVGAMTSAENGSEGYDPPVSTYGITSTVASPLSTTNQGRGGSNRTASVIPTAPSPTGAFTYALEVTNSQGSMTDEVVEVGYHSGVASTAVLFAYADSITTTDTSMPSGVSIQTITTSTCTTAGAIITTTSSGSTVATVVPELCTHGLAFLIFGLPGFYSSSDLSSLCHRLFSFPLGIVWRVFCPSGTPPIISITSVDPGVLPPGGGPPGENPNDGVGDDQTPPQNQRPSQATSTETTTGQTTQSLTTPTQTTQSTVSSSAAATPTRYVVMPLMDTTQSATDSLFAPFAQRENVTQAKGNDGSLKFFALELNDTEASTIDENPSFIIIQESELEIGMPDTGQTDPDVVGTGYLDPIANVGSRDLRDKFQGSKGGGLFRRIPLTSWIERAASWTLAMISLVPGTPLPTYKYGADGDEGGTDYPYYYIDAIEPGTNVRVYLLDTGLNMRHPEFNGRLKPGITSGQIQDDWDIDWLFPEVDDRETFNVRGSLGQTVRQSYTYNYIDPNSPNPNGGIHPAYSDFRLDQPEYGQLTPHGTRLSAFIIGNSLGQAQNCRYTVVKLPQYTNGPRSQSGVLFPLFSARDALNKITQDIVERKEQGEEYFVISSACGYVFGSSAGYNPFSSERGFIRMWENVLDWLDANEVSISASAGNARNNDPEIDLIPARLFQDPQIVVGSVTPDAMPHPQSQGEIGDGILTAYAPSAGALVVSSDPDGNYDYEWFDPSWSAVTSYGT